MTISTLSQISLTLRRTLIYLVAVALLYLYSASWKKKVLAGNVVVSVFSAFVILILMYAEKDYLLHKNSDYIDGEEVQLLCFSAFAFLISMVREIIKDIEDVKGDRLADYNTMPLAYGIPRAKVMAAFYAIGLLFLLYVWVRHLIIHPPFWLYLYSLATLFIPISYILAKLFSRSEFNAGFLSKLCKVVMVFGLILLIITAWFPYPIN